MLKYWSKFREVLDNVLMYFIPTKGEYLPQNDPKWPTEEKKNSHKNKSECTVVGLGPLLPSIKWVHLYVKFNWWIEKNR